MNILILNFYHAPTTDAHSYRWTQIARHYAKQGHNVDLLTGRVDGSPDKELLCGVQVKRLGLIKKKTVEVLNQAPDSFFSRVKLCFINFLRPFYRKIYWPDASWHWTPYVLREVYLRRKRKYDIVVSYYPCFGAHLAGRLLKSVSKFPNFKWILDYGDPFCASDTWWPNNYFIYDKLNRCVERSYAAIGKMVMTNEETRTAYLRKLGEETQITVFPHLVDIGVFYSQGYEHQEREGGGVNWLYVGAFHRGIREPHRLIEFVRALNRRSNVKVYLDMYGPANGFDLNPQDCPEIRHWGYLARELAVDRLKNADFIVNVDNENCVMTPSKIVECIATGRPIINVANSETCYAPMKAYEEVGYVLSQTSKQIDGSVLERAEEFIRRHMKGCTAPEKDLRTILSSHLIETIAEDYLNL
jgi:Glycosyltransferase Family 4